MFDCAPKMAIIFFPIPDLNLFKASFYKRERTHQLKTSQNPPDENNIFQDEPLEGNAGSYRLPPWWVPSHPDWKGTCKSSLGTLLG